MDQTAFSFDLGTLGYLWFRLLPIILPSYFILSSIFSGDVKGVIYLTGLIISCMIVILIARALYWAGITINKDADKSWDDYPIGQNCTSIRISQDTYLSSYAPLSTTTYLFTFMYLIYIMFTYKLVLQNIATILFFCIIIIADVIWILNNECHPVAGLVVAFVFGGALGLLFSYLIDRSGAVNLQYFNGLSDKKVCSIADTYTFKCQDQ